jgi:hypothetical protein
LVKGCSETLTFDLKRVPAAADDVAQTVAVCIVPRLDCAIRVNTGVHGSIFVFGWVEADLNHAVAAEEQQPNVQAQLSREPGEGSEDIKQWRRWSAAKVLVIEEPHVHVDVVDY